MDVLHKLLKVVDHDRWKVIGVVVALLVGVALVGCQSRTASVLTDEKVNRVQLQAEAMTLQARAEADAAQLAAGFADLDKQDEMRRTAIEWFSGIAAAGVQGTLSPTTAIAGLANLALLGLCGGSVVDGRRKDKVIATNTS